MNRFKRQRVRWPMLLLALLLPAAGVLVFLRLTGWFEDPKVALRELKAAGIAPTLASVFEASEAGDVERLTVLARAAVPMDGVNSTGDSVLHVAVAAQQWPSVNVLLKHVSNVDTANARGQMPLELTLRQGNYEAADALLAKGASPDGMLDGVPSLIALVKRTDDAGTEVLLQRGADPDIVNDRGESPLFLAMKSGRLALMASLLKAGADPNGITPGGQPLISYLLEHAKELRLEEPDVLTAVQQMLAIGVDLERPDSEQWRPIQYALASGLSSVTNELLPLVTNVDGTLWIALSAEDYAGARVLLEKGANVHERDRGGDTALIGMVRRNKPEMVRTLLDFGADPTRHSSEGQAAIPLSIVLRHDAVTLALVNHKNAPPPDEYLITPASLEFRKLFKNALLDFYIRNSIQQVTPLMAAVCLDQKEVVLALLEKGANRYAGTAPTKVFPIQLAAKRENVSMQQILIGVPWQDDQQERKFVINLAKQRVTLFKNGEAIRSSGISSGRSTHRTIPGSYVITDKSRMHHSNLYGGAEMPYFQRFSCTAMGFHQGALPGYPASHGCIRLPGTTAKFFFKESKLGDRVEVVKN